jgi:uncharacterized protein YkwD
MTAPSLRLPGAAWRSPPRRRHALPLLLALLAGAGCSYLPPLPPAAPAPGPAVQPGAGFNANEVARFAALADDYRRMQGCHPIVWHAAAARVAQAHSEDMGRRDFFSHENPNGATPFDRLRAAGVQFMGAAENIAFGQANARQVLQGWISSPSHRRSLEDCAFSHHGVGFDGRYWTHVLLRR